MRTVILLAATSLALTACTMRDIRAEQKQECAGQSGSYHEGEDWDDDVCVITRDRRLSMSSSSTIGSRKTRSHTARVARRGHLPRCS